MAATKQTDSSHKAESRKSSPCGDFEEISELMQTCCGSEGSFFRKMMTKICCDKREEETR
ncbi:MAG: hypothetical protein ACYS17_16970 [Planctomycetota bacterium]|jgi:hypothetical protein